MIIWFDQKNHFQLLIYIYTYVQYVNIHIIQAFKVLITKKNITTLDIDTYCHGI